MVSVLRPGQRILNIPGIGVQTSRRAVQVAAAAGWWVVAGKTSAGAYLAKGAASYAASKVNLANPGTYDLVNGTAYPTWDTATGWAFDTTQWLNTGISVSSNSWSCIVRFSGTSGGQKVALGCNNASGAVLLMPAGFSGNAEYFNGAASIVVAPPLGSGVMAIAGRKAYRNGVEESGSLGDGSWPQGSLYIGGSNYSGNLSWGFLGSIQAAAIYSDTLTAGEVATVYAAMAAL